MAGCAACKKILAALLERNQICIKGILLVPLGSWDRKVS
jgi:hypothetical protein